jgi:hypothetical protein
MPRGRPPKPRVEITDYTGIARLPDTRDKNGYRYTLVSRTNKAAVYKMVNVKEPEDTSVHYEVFCVLISPAVTLINRANGKPYSYPPSEKFPGNEIFGTSAWCYTDLTEAMQKYEVIK